MRHRRIACLIALLVLGLATAVPADAFAASGYVPPGLSGANQYTETLPGPGGNERTGPPSGGSSTPREALGNADAGRLEALGPEGRDAARLAAGGGRHKRTPGGAAGLPVDSSGGGSGGAGQVIGDLTGTSGGGGMGALLAVVILVTAGWAGYYAYGRRRPGQASGGS